MSGLTGILLWVLGWTLSLLLAYTIVRERRSPTSTTAWLALVLAFPYVGALLYLLIGTRKRSRRLRRRLRLPKHYVGAEPLAHGARGVEDFILRLGMLPSTDNRVRVHSEAAAARQALIDVIDAAQREIDFLVYSFDNDNSGRAILAALERAAARGVAVRLLVDDLGSWSLHDTHLQRIAQRGVRFRRFKPLWLSLYSRMANLRNHRKIVVADGEWAWTGGRNIGDCYLADHAEQQRWADLSLTVRGPAAAVLAEIARGDWHFATDDNVEVPIASPPPTDAGDRVQVLASGPDQRDDPWHAALLKALMDARRRIYIVTPYFVPDEALLQALGIAARSQIDVRILVPRRSDNLIVDLVGSSFLRELARFGATVMRYRAGMLHSKLVLVDDIAIIGSANLDSRSFFLNYEQMLFCHAGPAIAELNQYFHRLEARAQVGIRSRPDWQETLASCARVLAPML